MEYINSKEIEFDENQIELKEKIESLKKGDILIIPQARQVGVSTVLKDYYQKNKDSTKVCWVFNRLDFNFNNDTYTSKFETLIFDCINETILNKELINLLYCKRMNYKIIFTVSSEVNKYLKAIAMVSEIGLIDTKLHYYPCNHDNIRVGSLKKALGEKVFKTMFFDNPNDFYN